MCKLCFHIHKWLYSVHGLVFSFGFFLPPVSPLAPPTQSPLHPLEVVSDVVSELEFLEPLVKSSCSVDEMSLLLLESCS